MPALGAPVVLNLGCGTTISPLVANIDSNAIIRAKASPLGRAVGRLTGRDWSDMRLVRIHDLRRGIPYPDRSVDAVYQSHVLEHIDRDQVDGFVAEIRRVLRPGGVHRVVVPDLEPHVRAVVADLDAWDASGELAEDHEEHIGRALEQCVRRTPRTLRDASRGRRLLEGLLFGDARRRGETHQWMWTRVSLTRLLLRHGFRDVRRVDKDTSRIEGWQRLGLDRNAAGGDLHQYSLYMEAVTP